MKSEASIRIRALMFLAALGTATPAAAQPAPAPVPPPAPPPGLSPIAPPPMPPDPIAAGLAPHAGGLTPEEVAKTVAKTRHSVRSKQEDLKAAAAKVDQAFVNFFPRVTVSATYTRLSDINVANLGNLLVFGDTTLKVDPTKPPVAKIGFCDKTATSGPQCVVDPNGNPAVGYPLKFPVPLNSYSFVASLQVPISDYVFRISQGYAAAVHNEKSARLAAEAEALQAAADGKIAFYNWVRAKGAVIVAGESIDQVKSHVEDAKKAFTVGLASRADVLRIEAQLAAAQQAHAESGAMLAVVEEQLRLLLSAPGTEKLEIGSDVMHVPATVPSESLEALQDQSAQRRLEIRALDETIYSLKEVQNVTSAGYFPRLDGFADATYANPNQRIFPAQDRFDGTWDVGLRLSWTLNDTFTTIGAVAEAKARVASVSEQKATLKDGLRLEVASAYADAMKAPALLEAADRGLASAEESLRVRRELFRNGKATSTELLDAEGELTQARLRRLDAHVGLLVARARLEHATGRDVPLKPTEN